MANQSKLRISPLREIYLRYQIECTLGVPSVQCINEIRHVLTQDFSRPESQDKIFDPIIQVISNHFKLSGLDWACAGVRWCTFFINLCTNVISAVTTTKTWVKVLNVICIVAIMVSVILEILTHVKHFKMTTDLEQTLTGALKKHLLTQTFDIPSDLGLPDMFSEPQGNDKVVDNVDRIISHQQPALLTPSPSTSASPSSSFSIIDSDSSSSSDGGYIDPVHPIFGPVSTFRSKGGKRKATKEAAHWYTIVKRCLSLTLVVVAFGVTKGDLQAMQAWIVMDKFKDVVTKNFTAANDVIDWLATDVCGFEFTEKSEALKTLEKQIIESEEYLATSTDEFAEKPTMVQSLADHINRTTKLVQTAGSIVDPAIKNSVDILKQRQTTLVGNLDDILKTIQMKSIRQEPVPILIYGDEGVGKSTYVTNVLIPSIANRLKLDKSCYTVKFTGSDKYWPEYANQPFALFDEAFDRASDVIDPMVESFNTVCSKVPYNMQGAFNKYQMCNFKFVFVITNKKTCPKLSHMLSTEASTAFWHRFGSPIHFEIKTAYKSVSGVRGSHKFKPDWSHVDLRECSTVLNPSNGTYTVTSETSISHDQLVQRMITDYNRRMVEFANTKMAIAQESDDTSSFAVNISGPTGSGKSYTARYIARMLSSFTNKPVFEHNNKISGEIKTGIHIANDVIPYNESDYNRLYNECNGVLINTNNCTYVSNLTWVVSKPYNFFLDCIGCLPYSEMVPLPYAEHSKDLSQFTEVGTARRLGIPGNHSSKFGNVKVSDAEAVSFVQTRRGFLKDMSTGKEYDLPSATNYIWKKYCTFLEVHSKIEFSCGIIPPVQPDIDIFFENESVCKATLQSKFKTLAAIASPNDKRYVKVFDPRKVFEGTIVDENYFLLPNVETLDTQSVIKTMISNLRHLGIKAVVKVQIGNEIYLAKGNHVVTSKQENMPSLECTTNTADIKFGEEVILSIPIEEAVKGFYNGFTGYSATQLEYLLFYRQQIESTSLGIKTICDLKRGEVQKQQALSIIENRNTLKDVLVYHPSFPYLIALFVCISSAAIIGLVAVLTRYCCTPAEEEVNIDADVVQETFPDEGMERAFEDHAKKRNLKPDEITRLRKMRLAYDRPLNMPIGDKEYDSITARQESLENCKTPLDDFLMKKIYQNMVVCTTSSGNSVHGVILKENIVVTTFHLGQIEPQIVCDHGSGMKVFSCEVVCCMPDRDLQFWRITDKTFPPAPSIVQYLPKTDLPQMVHSQLVVVSTPNYNVSCTLVPEVIYNYENWAWAKGGYVANFHSSRGAVTRPGYCGFVYISNDHKTIHGIHVGSKAKGTFGLMTILSQDIVTEALTTTAIPEVCQPRDENYEAIQEFGEVLSIGEEEWGLLPCSYFDSWSPEKFSKHAIPDSEALVYVAKVPYNNPFPRKSKFKRTGFPEFDELPNTHAPAPLKVLEGMELECDVLGRPDIALTQVAKFGGVVHHADREVLKVAQAMVKEHIVSVCGNDMVNGHFPVATMDEVINGFGLEHPLHDYVEHINMQSGAGFYWKHKWNVARKGVLFYQDADRYVFRNSEAAVHLQQVLNTAEMWISKGIPPLFVNEDCIKTELLPSEKVKIGKARLFSVADTVEVLLERKYFLYALATFSKYHNDMPVKLGANPMKDFNVWARLMRRYGDTMIEGDFSRFDKNIIYDFILAALSVLLDDPNLAYIFAQIISYSFHHIYDFIYHTKGKGQNSGSGITTLLNSVSLMIMVAYAYIKIYYKRTGRYPKGNLFVKILLFIYGDDLNWIADASLPPDMVAEIFRELGLDFTYAVKPINESLFLSRQFHFVDGSVFAALKIPSFSRHLYWTSEEAPEQRATELSLVLDEAAAHNKEIYQKCLNCIFHGLKATNDCLTLSLIDWRCFSTRRAVLRRVMHTDACFTREPISCGDAFTTFPAIEQFNTYCRNRYSRAEKVLRIQEREPIIHISEPYSIPAITVAEYLKNLQEVQQEMASNTNTTPSANLAGDVSASKVRAEVVPPVAVAHASVAEGTSNISEIPVGPTPPVQITNAIDQTPPLVVGNSLQAPSLLEAGGIMNNVVTAAYSNWYLVGQGTVAIDAASNTKVFELPYGLDSLSGAPKVWVSMHERYTGPIRYLIETIGSNALAGTIMVGWTPDITNNYTVSDLMRFGKWINMPMNVTTTGHFVVPDVRKNDFYRDVGDSATHGIVGVIHVPLTNPYGSTGGSVTYNVYVMLDPEFQVSMWREIPATVSTSYPTLRVGDILDEDVRFIIDGYELGKTYMGDIYLPGNTVNSVNLDNVTSKSAGLWATNSVYEIDNSGPEPIYTTTEEGHLLAVIGNNPPAAEFSELQETHTSSSPIGLSVNGIWGAYSGYLADAFSKTNATSTFNWSSWSCYWDTTSYGHYFFDDAEHNDITPEIPNAGATWTSENLAKLSEPDLTVTYWAYPFSQALPADYLRVTTSKYTYPLNGSLVDTAGGRASVPPNQNSQRLIAALITFAGNRTLEFDLLSEYGGAAVLTCRFDNVNGLYCRMNTDRTRAYMFQNAVSKDMLITNIRIVDNATIMRQSPTIFFAPRYSTLTSIVQNTQRRLVRRTLQERFERLNPFTTTKVKMSAIKEAEATLMALSAIGGAAQGAAAAGGSIFTRKKDREFAQEMMEAQQNFAREMWSKQTAVNQADKLMGMGYDWYKQQGSWAHQSAMQQAIFQHQNQHDVGMWGLNSMTQALSMGSTFRHQTAMQASAQANQQSMQQASFAHDESMQQQRIDAQMAAYGVTNPAANVQTPGTSSAATQTMPTNNAGTQTGYTSSTNAAQTMVPTMTSMGTQTSGPGQSYELSQMASSSKPSYAPASHRRPPGTPSGW
nr:MAG: polyprotein [Wufeng shrew picorna-like virus 11]